LPPARPAAAGEGEVVAAAAIPAAAIPAASVLPLYTPAAAAKILAVRESWLRRRAAARTVPCRFIGKHLRFSHADVVAIAEAGATAAGPSHRPRRRRTPPGRHA
jgi:hypothetical protein